MTNTRDLLFWGSTSYVPIPSLLLILVHTLQSHHSIHWNHSHHCRMSSTAHLLWHQYHLLSPSTLGHFRIYSSSSPHGIRVESLLRQYPQIDIQTISSLSTSYDCVILSHISAFQLDPDSLSSAPIILLLSEQATHYSIHTFCNRWIPNRVFIPRIHPTDHSRGRHKCILQEKRAGVGMEVALLQTAIPLLPTAISIPFAR